MKYVTCIIGKNEGFSVYINQYVDDPDILHSIQTALYGKNCNPQTPLNSGYNGQYWKFQMLSVYVYILKTPKELASKNLVILHNINGQ